ncbi:squalene/phytoene synthase family protein [Fontisphaera persica]|uniref:squalene/phytoene synthase family protein n=1 Tax=Fontisphaera persica TaxID=2974023 RepID=UPI0024BFCA3C|nr:squalene/phytoene synthase family protein [Fontisphaera persica]WCJ59739.1 squalene/phytoene synthase family protein [Fontisphaera persica]
MNACGSIPWPLLQQVSRSFYLSLRWLPAAVRPQLALAYLLARATDTVADTDIVPWERRLESLERLRACIMREASSPPDWKGLAGQQNLPAERELLEKAGELMGMLERMAEEDQALIRGVLSTITSGQMLDLQRFGLARSPDQVRALAHKEELVDYTYRVAGCVGDFWTRLCCAHLRPAPAMAVEELAALGVKFGQGLQLVNILRDLPRDLRQGRCYLPAEELRAAGLLPADLLDPRCEGRLRPVYDRWLAQARQWLADGWHYTLALPASWHRLRLACALPNLLGIKTLAMLRENAILNPELRLKVTRAELRGILWRMILCYPWPNKWKQLPDGPFFLNP